MEKDPPSGRADTIVQRGDRYLDMRPLLSVIIPAYNCKDLLDDSAGSVLNLLIFQAFQDVRMASSLVRSTIQTLGIPRVFAFGGWLDLVGSGWMNPRTHDAPKPLKLQHYILRDFSNYRFKGLKKQVMVFILLNGYTDKKHINRDMWRIYSGIQQRIPELHIRAAFRA